MIVLYLLGGAATQDMIAIAERTRPHAACLVPERREERTTEGGLDVAGQHNHVAPFVGQLREAGVRVSESLSSPLPQMSSPLTELFSL